MYPYRFQKINLSTEFLNNSVDKSYLIHLENNGRYDHIQKQLSEYHLTNKVYIYYLIKVIRA